MDPKVLQRAVLGLPTNPKIEPYAALSALQAQNKATRMKQAQAAQAPAATAPVASRTLAEAAELNNPYAAGLGVAPVASPVSEAPVGMAGGGMVAFAGGGDVEHFQTGNRVYATPEAFDNSIPGLDAGSLYAEALRKAQAGRPLSPVEATVLQSGPPASSMAPPSRLAGTNIDMPAAMDNTIPGMETGSLYKDAMDKIKAKGEAKKDEPMSGQSKALLFAGAPLAAAADIAALPVNAARRYIRNPLDTSEPASLTPVYDARNRALYGDEKTTKGEAKGEAKAAATGFEAQIAKQIADLEAKTGRTLSEGAKDVLRQQEMAKLLKDSKGVKSTADMPTPSNIKSDANAGLAGAAATRGNRGSAGTGAAGVGLGAAAGRGGYNLDLPKAQTTEERLAEIDAVKERMGAKNAEYLRPMQEQLDKYAEDAKAQKTQGKYEALMQAGLGMMAGKSRYAMQNIGEGGSMGLAALREANKLNRAADDKLMQGQNDMVKSRIALEKGDETAAMQFANQGRQEMKDRATLQLTAQHYANSDAAQMMQAQAAMSRANALGGNEDKHTAVLTKVRGLLNQDPEYKELAKMAGFKGTMGDNARTRMAELERKLYGQLAPELLQGAGGNTMGAGGPQLAQADLALINKYSSPR
jgi:hypothetical protein